MHSTAYFTRRILPLFSQFQYKQEAPTKATFIEIAPREVLASQLGMGPF
jgi:hypothetical protein